MVSTTPHQTTSASSHALYIKNATAAPAPSMREPKLHASTPVANRWFPSGYAYVFPPSGPRRINPATDAIERQGPRNQPGTISHQNWSQLTRLASNEKRKAHRDRTVRRNRPRRRGNPQPPDPSQTAPPPDCSPTMYRSGFLGWYPVTDHF